MKPTDKDISKFFALIAIFLLFGNQAIASIKLDFDGFGKNPIVSTFQEENQEKPFLFNKISIGEVSQTISQNENLGFGLFGMVYSRQEYSRIEVSNKLNSSYLLKDKRELIFQYLFPFHFFW